jgi:hypothetical protein
MKKLFKFAIALLSMFALLEPASALVYNVTVPAGTFECYIAGNFPTQAWSPKDRKLTKVDATHYTITIADATEAMEYKYCSGPDWPYVEKDSLGAELAANRTWTASDKVAKWAAIFDPNIPPLPMDITINVLTPVTTLECYLVGTFNSWAGPTAPNCKMTLIDTSVDGKIYSISFHSDDANKLAYHFCSGPDWSYEQKAPTGDYKYPELAPVVTEWKKIYDPSKVGTIAITADVPLGTDSCWIQGSFLGWNFDGKGAGGALMTKVADGKFTFDVKMVASIEYRLYNRPDWGHPEADSLGAERKNRMADYPADATTSIKVIQWKTPLTGINAISVDKYKVYAERGAVIISGAKAQVELFDASGRRIVSQKANGTFTSKKLQAGLYIVRVDGVTQKVFVR